MVDEHDGRSFVFVYGVGDELGLLTIRSLGHIARNHADAAGEGCQFLKFASADTSGDGEAFPSLGDPADHIESEGLAEAAQFEQRSVKFRVVAAG